MKGIRRILIINGKGGCGKSTIATNLAVTYAREGRRTALLDYDSQASSTDWSELRNAGSPEHRSLPLQVIPMHKKAGMYQTRAYYHQLSGDVERLVIDTPSGARERDIDTLIKQCDVVLVPMLSSPLDIRSGSRFIAELLTHRGFRANPRAVGVIANRLQDVNGSAASMSPDQSPGAKAVNEQKLLHALECLNVPCVANFADSVLYGRAAEEGKGITELEVTDQASLQEQHRWVELVNWLESQPRRLERVAQPPRAVASSTALASSCSDAKASREITDQTNGPNGPNGPNVKEADSIIA